MPKVIVMNAERRQRSAQARKIAQVTVGETVRLSVVSLWLDAKAELAGLSRAAWTETVHKVCVECPGPGSKSLIIRSIQGFEAEGA